MHDPVLFGVEGIPDPLDAAHDALWSALRHIDAFGEKSRARARHKDAMRRAIKAINSSEPNPDIRDEIISHYQKLRRPQWPKRGRPENANTLRDQCIADIVEEIRRRGFDVHRSRATKEEPRIRKLDCRSGVAQAGGWRGARNPIKARVRPVSGRSH